MDPSELEYKRNLLEAHKRRLETLNIKKARMGMNTPSEIITELEDINKEINKIENEIKGVVDFEAIAFSSESEGENFSGIFAFLDNYLVLQVQKLTDLIQYNTRLQTNFNILKDLLNHIENNESDVNASDISSFIQEKMIASMNSIKLHQCYFILARSSYILKEYEECSKHIEHAIKMEERSEYRILNAEALYGIAKDIYKLSLEKMEENPTESKPIFLIAKENLLQAVNNWERAKKLGSSSREVKSLREDLKYMQKEIDDRLREIESIELREQEQRERDAREEQERLQREKEEKEEEEVRETEERERRIFQQGDYNQFEG